MVPKESVVPLLQSYIPPLILRQVERDPSPLKNPTAERITAAVLFADITNFTYLSEQLALSEESSPEHLASLLNRFFDLLIDVIDFHGGEVTKFAGDALIAIWPLNPSLIRFSPATRLALEEAVERAARCGQAIQERFPVEPIDGLMISVEIGVGVGDIYSVYVGGELDRWEFLLSGSPLIQMSQAVKIADAGDVILSPQAWEAIKESFTGQKIDDGFVRLGKARRMRAFSDETSRSKSDQVILASMPFIPAAISTRLRAGMVGWLSELRTVSILFILLPGYGTSITHPFERTLPEAQRVMQAMQEALYRFGGSINKLNVDDKGITLVAAFGLPPFSHPDDAARAVHAALLMQSELEHLGRDSAIGITTGLVFCGPIGNNKRSEYTLIGRQVNLATRLMQVAESNLRHQGAHSDIICDEATFQEVREQGQRGRLLARQISFSSKISAEVKGLSNSIAVYRPQMRPWIEILREQSYEQHSGSLVGRQEELEKILTIIGSLETEKKKDNSHLIILEGEAGMGKSFVVGEVRRVAEERNLRVLIGVGQRLEQSSEYHAWKPIFQEYYAIESSDDIETRKAKVLAKLPYMPGEKGYPALARDLSPLLNPVLSVKFPETTTTRGLSSAERKQITQDFMLRLLQIAATPRKKQEKSVSVIVMEDVQWLDKESWDMLLAVSKNVSPLILLLTIRPLTSYERRQLPNAGEKVIDSEDANWVQLDGMSIEQIDSLASQSIGVTSLSPDLIGYLHHKTGGHPQLCKELVTTWHESGFIDTSSAVAELTCDPTEIDDLPIPIEIHKAVIGRVDQLSAAQQTILKIASVIEQPIDAITIQKHYPRSMDGQVMDRLLLNLERLRYFKLESAQSGERNYTFENALVKEQIRSLVPKNQRSQILSR